MRKIPLFRIYSLINLKKKNTAPEPWLIYPKNLKKIDISGQMTVAALNWNKIKVFGYRIAMT